LCFLVAISFALDLDEAQAQGLVGEKDNGILWVVVSTKLKAPKTLVNEVKPKTQ